MQPDHTVYIYGNLIKLRWKIPFNIICVVFDMDVSGVLCAQVQALQCASAIKSLQIA